MLRRQPTVGIQSVELDGPPSNPSTSQLRVAVGKGLHAPLSSPAKWEQSSRDGLNWPPSDGFSGFINVLPSSERQTSERHNVLNVPGWRLLSDAINSSGWLRKACP